MSLTEWIIYDADGNELQHLWATKEFVDAYCKRTGYVRKEYVVDAQSVLEPSDTEVLDTLLGVKSDEQNADG